MEDTLWASLTDTYAQLPMALTAEKLAEQYSISRDDCDQFAMSSQNRWLEGRARGVCSYNGVQKHGWKFMLCEIDKPQYKSGRKNQPYFSKNSIPIVSTDVKSIV